MVRTGAAAVLLTMLLVAPACSGDDEPGESGPTTPSTGLSSTSLVSTTTTSQEVPAG